MKCQSCNQEILDTAKFCPLCGAAQTAAEPEAVEADTVEVEAVETAAAPEIAPLEVAALDVPEMQLTEAPQTEEAVEIEPEPEPAPEPLPEPAPLQQAAAGSSELPPPVPQFTEQYAQQPPYQPAAQFAPQQQPPAPLNDQMPAAQPIAVPIPQPAAQPTQLPAPQQQPIPQPAEQPTPQPIPQYSPQQPAPQQPVPQYSPQQPAAQQPLPPYVSAAQAAAAQPAKKKSKLPFILIPVILVLLIIGALVALAFSGIIKLPSLGGSSGPVSELIDSGNKLSTSAESGTMEISFDVDVSYYDLQGTITYKWQYGKDLKSSKFWIAMPGEVFSEFAYGYGSYDEVGVIMADDTLYIYVKDGSDIEVMRESGITAEMNAYLNKQLDTDEEIDLNKIIKNGSIDSDYVNHISELYAEQEVYSNNSDSEDAEAVSTILSDFLEKECSKESVYEGFLLNYKESKSGSATTYSFDFDLLYFLDALEGYAEQRGEEDDELAGGADELVDACQELSSVMGSVSIRIPVEYTVTDGLLTSFAVEMSGGSYSAALDITISKVNKTDLENDADYQEIIDTKPSSSGGGITDYF
ncbi:MAG: zinc-ribbon domain-containing protein [Coriobacteriales bacterium]|jgi:hypothetical protein|nr:zinc-ribbon domain-containing protein [Coriobacteriales bacterium]